VGESGVVMAGRPAAPGRALVGHGVSFVALAVAYSGLHQLCAPLLDHLGELPLHNATR
jgi:hypothetical protein